MRDPNECKYCSDKGDSILDTRTQLSRKGDFYPGIDLFIEDDELNIIAVGDTHETSYVEDEVKINYCPMCGRSLKDERSK